MVYREKANAKELNNVTDNDKLREINQKSEKQIFDKENIRHGRGHKKSDNYSRAQRFKLNKESGMQ